MRILQVAPFYAPHRGGVESHVRALTGELVRQGHAVEVLTSRHVRSLPKDEVIDGVPVRRVPTLGVLWNTPIDPAMGRAIREFDPDVVHFHYPPPLTSYFAVRGLRGRRIPSVLTYHCDLYLPGISGRILTSLFERVFLPRTLDGVDRILVHTQSYGATSRGLRGRTLTIIPSAVDVTRFRPEVDGGPVRARLGIEGRRVLAFTGRLVPHKGVDEILRALVELPPDVVLLVIGSGPRLGSLLTLARRLGVEDRVRFCPQVSDEELPSYLRAADLFVFPSQNRLEGFGLVIAEAMAAGLPVVVADMPGVREVIAEGVEGLLVEPMIAEDLANKIARLLGDPATRQRMAIAGRRRAEERFALPVVVGALLRTYRELLEGPVPA
ncbi:MAG TPA: glycosyltransferase family 4 protein [Thermoplasmata archaeon]|nr:glycosyltransferase family 4 protein [Thermoplasmata archaeon]